MWDRSAAVCFIRTLDYYLASVNKAFKFPKVELTSVQKSYRQVMCLYNSKPTSALSGGTSLE